MGSGWLTRMLGRREPIRRDPVVSSQLANRPKILPPGPFDQPGEFHVLDHAVSIPLPVENDSFNAQPEAPACPGPATKKAGASGWALNEQMCHSSPVGV